MLMFVITRNFTETTPFFWCFVDIALFKLCGWKIASKVGYDFVCNFQNLSLGIILTVEKSHRFTMNRRKVICRCCHASFTWKIWIIRCVVLGENETACPPRAVRKRSSSLHSLRLCMYLAANDFRRFYAMQITRERLQINMMTTEERWQWKRQRQQQR